MVSPKATTHSLIHEYLHARSVSHYGAKTYLTHMAIEELTVEFSREISKKESVAITHASAYNLVDGLREINRALRIAETDMVFAKRLFEVPLPERRQWLEQQILGHAVDFTTYNKLMAILEVIDEWKRE